MPGNRIGGLKARDKNLASDPDFYKKIGHLGGSAWSDKPKGFANNPALAKEVGMKVGLRTRKGYKWLGDVDKLHGRYKNKKTGEEVIIKYSREVEPM